MARRRKAAALAVPETEAEAVAMLDQYVKDERTIRVAREACDRMVSQYQASRDSMIAEYEPAQKLRFAALKSWWEAGGKARAGAKRSADMAGAKIGFRVAPPTVVLDKGKTVAAVIAWLSRSAWCKTLLRSTPTLDKPAIIKAAREQPLLRVALADEGVRVVQADEFFIETGPVDLSFMDPDA